VPEELFFAVIQANRIVCVKEFQEQMQLKHHCPKRNRKES